MQYESRDGTASCSAIHGPLARSREPQEASGMDRYHLQKQEQDSTSVKHQARNLHSSLTVVPQGAQSP